MGKGGIKQRQSGEERRKGWDAKKISLPLLCFTPPQSLLV